MTENNKQRTKAIDKLRVSFAADVYGQTSHHGHYHLAALGRKLYSDNTLGFVSDSELLKAIGRIVIQIADDISDIYGALEIYQKKTTNKDRLAELIDRLAEDYYELEQKRKADKKRLKEHKGG